MADILPVSLLDGQDGLSLLSEEFGLSLYSDHELLPNARYSSSFTKPDSNGFFDFPLFVNDSNSQLVDWSLWPDSELNLICDPSQDGVNLSDDPSPLSSLPSSPTSSFSPNCTSSPEQQEINDIVSSLQDTPTSPSFPETFPSSLSPSFLSPSLPQKRSRTEDDNVPVVKRSSPKMSATTRKQRKKEQNKTAASRYRQKKKDELESLQKQEQELELSNKQLKAQVDNLTAEINYLKSLWSEVCETKREKLSF